MLQAAALSQTARLERLASAPSICFVGQYWQYDYQLLQYTTLHRYNFHSFTGLL